jgi:ABC-type uncharacterized transport system involved in gliding motility auxiliary subunit
VSILVLLDNAILDNDERLRFGLLPRNVTLLSLNSLRKLQKKKKKDKCKTQLSVGNMKRILYEYKQNRVEPQFTPLHSKSRLYQLGLLVLQKHNECGEYEAYSL